MKEMFIDFMSSTNTLLYTYILIPVLLLVGIFFTIRIKGGQFMHLKHALKLITKPAETKDDGSKGLSPFKAFTISAASHIGIGNIVGVALAISVGGPGAVFWMWMTAIIGGATSFVENTLGQIFKEKGEDGSYKGGPAYYMTKGLGLPKLGVIFSIVISVVYGFMFNAIQANTVGVALGSAFGIGPAVVGIILVVLVGAVIFGGLDRIADMTSLVVPFMAVAYMGLAFFIVIMNISQVPAMFALIFKSAFNFKAAAGGLVSGAILEGVRRGLYTNEAGMGSVPNASATAEVSHPAKSGLIQALGVYLNSILVCSATAFIIILAGEGVYANPGLQGLQITQNALAAQVGGWAQIFLTVCVFMFAFSTLVGNYYYGENNLANLGLKKTGTNIYRLLVLAVIFIGCVADFSLVWSTGDIFMGFMALINLFAILFLSKIAVETYNDYFKQLKTGIDPVFKVSNIKSLDKVAGKITVWEK